MHGKGKDFMETRQEEYRFELLRAEETGPTWRRELELIFLLEGSGWLRLEGGETPYALSREDIFTINSFQLRNLELEPGALAVSLQLSPLFLTTISPDTPHPNVTCQSFLYGADAQGPFDALRRQLALAFRAQYKNESALSVHLRGRVTGLVDVLFCCFLAGARDVKAETGRERMRAAVEYLHAHYRENITLAQLSEETFLSGPYLSRSFVKYLGMPFTSYLTRLRVRQAAVLLAGEGTVTEVAYECGFPNANAFIDAFKHHRGVTPGQHRRNLRQTVHAHEGGEPLEEGFSNAFAALMKYAEEPEKPIQAAPALSRALRVQVGGEGQALTHSWRTMINAGYARDLLVGDVREQLRQIQRSVGFTYFRCKGILDDDMLLCTRRMDGTLQVSCVYLDEVIDFILSLGAKPMLEFSHMPSVLAGRRAELPGRLGRIAPPTDIKAWRALLDEVLCHLLERYGREALESWLFTPWTSPEFSSFGMFTPEEFAETYLTAHRAIKEGGAGLRVCGPGLNLVNLTEISNFLDWANRQGCLPDVLSARAFSAVDPAAEESGIKLLASDEAFQMATSGDERYLARHLKELKALLEQKDLPKLPIMLDEWSNNIWQRDLCNDTCYKSAYLFKNILENYDSCRAMGYFSACDRLDELPPTGDSFSGGFGLFTHDGLPKSAFRAMELLARAGDSLLARGEGYFITARRGDIQIFLYNYSHYDALYRYRHTTNLTKTDRYRVLNAGTPQAYHIKLEGLTPGTRAIRRYSVGPKGGSAFDAWVAMGAPERPTAEEREALLHLSHPVYRAEQAEAGRGLSIHATLLPLEVQLITVTRA